jgi:hypothetical protein
MHHVSRFEANLLRLLYFFLRREPVERALPLVENRMPPPACLSRNAVRLAQDALAKGCTFLLAQRGGWRSERYLRDERVVEGRLWERTPPEQLGLSFSQHSLEFLIWITAVQPGDKDPAWKPDVGELTVGDLMLLYFAHEGLREGADSLGCAEMRRREPYNRHGLCWLAYPEDYVSVPETVTPDFTPWTAGLGSCMLEALQRWFSDRWLGIEGRKEGMLDPQAMRRLGRSQERVLTAFLDAVHRTGRLDLARFLLRTLALLLTPGVDGRNWIGGLQTAGLRLADRAASYQAALALVRQTERFQTWMRRARTIGYFDEGYEAAKLYLSDWEQYHGDELHERAQHIVRQVDPLRQA